MAFVSGAVDEGGLLVEVLRGGRSWRPSAEGARIGGSEEVLRLMKVGRRLAEVAQGGASHPEGPKVSEVRGLRRRCELLAEVLPRRGVIRLVEDDRRLRSVSRGEASAEGWRWPSGGGIAKGARAGVLRRACSLWGRFG